MELKSLWVCHGLYQVEQKVNFLTCQRLTFDCHVLINEQGAGQNIAGGLIQHTFPNKSTVLTIMLLQTKNI